MGCEMSSPGMVRMGTMTTKTRQPKLSTYSKLLTAAWMLYIIAPMPTKQSRKAANIQAVRVWK